MPAAIDERAAAPAARPGKATLRPGRGEVRLQVEELDDLPTISKDPEMGTPAPLLKVIELQTANGTPNVLVRAGKPRADHRAFTVDLGRYGCVGMTPRLRGLVLLNLVRPHAFSPAQPTAFPRPCRPHRPTCCPMLCR
jgi:hypothetical protein